MFSALLLAWLRRLQGNAVGFAMQGQSVCATRTAHLAPPLAPSDSADEPTCRCGRYELKPRTVFHWTIDPETRALRFQHRVESPGRVTSAEIACWQTGRQSTCVDPVCVFMAVASEAPGAPLAPAENPLAAPTGQVEQA